VPISRVIILNGVGSVGKSATAKALQTMTSTPFLHVSMDAFLEMLPEARLSHPDGLLFEPATEDGMPTVAIRTGPVFARAMRGMRHACVAMAAQGNNLIIDEVFIEPGVTDAYRELLRNCQIHLVGLFASLEVLEARERARGDREIGLARWQYRRVHSGVAYDLKIDTTAATPADCARVICNNFGL
jgi:chloramphenicol 3-O phosphotransferase